jgi:tripartite ATP-independent transporter DctP family solute receptor
MSMPTLRRRKILIGTGVSLAVPTSVLAQPRAREFKLGFQSPRGNSLAEGADRFAEAVARLSSGQLKVNVFPGGALGGDVQMISGVRTGTIDMALMSAGLLASLVKDFELVDLPYLFDSMDHGEAVIDGPFGQRLLGLLEPRGVVGLGFTTCSFRNLTNSRRPITRLEDMRGLKIRVLQSPLALDLWKTLGTNAVPMPFPELYTALEQKAVDGQENPLPQILINKFFEVQKFLSLTRHVALVGLGIFSKPVWDQLNTEEQSIMRQGWAVGIRQWRSGARRDEEAAMAQLRSSMSVNEIAPAEIGRIRAAARPVIDRHTGSANPDVVKLLMSEAERLRTRT